MQARGLVAVVADPKGKDVQAPPRGLSGSGDLLDIDAGRGEVGAAQGAGGLHLLQDEGEGVGAIEPGDQMDRDGVGGGRWPAVDVPAQDATRAWGGGVEAL